MRYCLLTNKKGLTQYSYPIRTFVQLIVNVGFGRLLLVKTPDWIKVLIFFETCSVRTTLICQKSESESHTHVGLENVNLCRWLHRQIKLEEK